MKEATMDMMKVEQLTIKWLTRDPSKISKIRRRFAIPDYTTLNGLSPAEISAADMPVFEECMKRGLFCIVPLKWCKNGGRFAFISCK